MQEVLEITTFKLAGATAEAFLAANEDINGYLKRQPGFRWRRIAFHDDGLVADIVAFDSAEQASRSADGIMTEMRSSPVHAMIDQTTVDWRIMPVLSYVVSP